MKQFKPLLPLGGVTALARLIWTFLEAGVADVRVVVGHRHEELVQLVEKAGGRIVLNGSYQEGMFSSVLTGIRTIEPEVDAFFVQPVDVPLVRPATIRRLLQEYRQRQSEVIYPCFLGKRGHPPLIAGRLAQAIISWQGEGGLKAVLSLWETGARNVAVADEMVLCDMDTPEAYQTLAARTELMEVPSGKECQALLTGCNERIIRHGRVVARVAVTLGECLNRAGYGLNLPLLAAAALLHDLVRQEPDHARAGACRLRDEGFDAVADLVAEHMDFDVNVHSPLSAAAVLYLADKLVCGDRRVSLTERFKPALETHADQLEVAAKIRSRLMVAQHIQQRIEEVSGIPLPTGIRAHHAC
jgi:CTP:molybdopterin cytidylyltransferase MocA